MEVDGHRREFFAVKERNNNSLVTMPALIRRNAVGLLGEPGQGISYGSRICSVHKANGGRDLVITRKARNGDTELISEAALVRALWPSPIEVAVNGAQRGFGDSLQGLAKSKQQSLDGQLPFVIRQIALKRVLGDQRHRAPRDEKGCAKRASGVG